MGCSGYSRCRPEPGSTFWEETKPQSSLLEPQFTFLSVEIAYGFQTSMKGQKKCVRKAGAELMCPFRGGPGPAEWGWMHTEWDTQSGCTPPRVAHVLLGIGAKGMQDP